LHRVDGFGQLVLELRALVGGTRSLGRDAVRDRATLTVLLLGLLAAEITACSGRDPNELYLGLTQELGLPFYERLGFHLTGIMYGDEHVLVLPLS